MILLGIKLFLRADELLSLQVEQFPPDFQIVDIEKFSSFSVMIQGKCDVIPVHLQIFLDNDCTEFCPVRHLLVYVAMAGITEG